MHARCLSVRRVETVRVVLALLIALGATLVVPTQAVAGWPLAADAAVLLGFGASYSTGDGDASLHRGADIAAQPGERVVAPLAGTVSFVGRVPAVGGGRVLAATLQTAEGKITLLPFDRVDVARGDELAEGAGIGLLAANGDGSSEATHLHVGTRTGDLYVDPLGVIAPPLPPTEPDPGDGGEGAGEEAGEGAEEGAGELPGDGAETGEGAGAGAGAGVWVPGGEGAELPVTDPGLGAGAGTPAGMPNGVTLAPQTGVGEAAAPSGAGITGGTATRAQRLQSAGSPTAGGLGAGVSLARGAAAGARAAAPITGLEQTARSAGARGAAAVESALPGATAAGERAARAVDAASAGFAALFARARAAATSGVRVAAWTLVGLLGAVGTLWPLWRSATRAKELGKECVSPVADDIAAVPSR